MTAGESIYTYSTDRDRLTLSAIAGWMVILQRAEVYVIMVDMLYLAIEMTKRENGTVA